MGGLDQVLAVEVAAPTLALEAPEPAEKGRKRFSARTLARMAAAQKASWAAKRGEVARPVEVESKATPAAESAATPGKPKRRISAALRKARFGPTQSRWAKAL